MRVTVEFYADYRRAAGGRKAEVEVPRHATVRDLLAFIARRFPALEDAVQSAAAHEGLDSHMLVVIDGRIAAPETLVRPNDKVRLIPPISGG